MTIAHEGSAQAGAPDNSQLVDEWWSDPGRQDLEALIQWTAPDEVRDSLWARATDNSGEDWISHAGRLLDEFPKPRTALSVGCGFGIIERIIRQRDICQEIDGVDLAQGAIEAARKSAEDEGLTGLNYWTADLNAIELPVEKYDVVWAHASLHHTYDLERLFAQIRQSLKPNGLFVVYEYVGPARMQFPKAYLELADRILKMIPERYRREHRTKTIKAEAPRLSLAGFEASDPSEAIRASEIVPLIASRFEIEHYRHLGGTLAMMVLDGIAGNFMEPNDQVAHQIVEWVLLLDNTLIDAGVIPSYHAYLVALNTDNQVPVQTRDFFPPIGLGRQPLTLPSVPGMSQSVTNDDAVALARLFADLQRQRNDVVSERARTDGTLAERERLLQMVTAERDRLLIDLGVAREQAREAERRLRHGHRLCRMSWKLRKKLLGG